MNDRRIRRFDLSAMVTKNQASVKSRFGFRAKQARAAGTASSSQKGFN